MLPIYAGIIAGTVAAGILCYFLNDTEQERKAYYEEKKRYINNIQELRSEIKQAKRNLNTLYDPFQDLHMLYINSIKLADYAYEARKNAMSLSKKRYLTIQTVKNKMVELYEKTKTDISYSEKEEIHLELANLKKFKEGLFEEQKKYKEEQESFMQDVSSLNNETRQLKEYIRDNCGHGGRVWYERKESRNAQRKHKLV